MRESIGLTVLACLICLTASADAQRIIAWDRGPGPGLGTDYFDELSTLTPAFPFGGTPLGPVWGSSGAVFAPAIPFGATAIDNTTGIQYVTDGATIGTNPYPWYPPPGPAAPIPPEPTASRTLVPGATMPQLAATDPDSCAVARCQSRAHTDPADRVRAERLRRGSGYRVDGAIRPRRYESL